MTVTKTPHEWPPDSGRPMARGVARRIIRAAMPDDGDPATVDVVFDLLVTVIKARRR